MTSFKFYISVASPGCDESSGCFIWRQKKKGRGSRHCIWPALRFQMLLPPLTSALLSWSSKQGELIAVNPPNWFSNRIMNCRHLWLTPNLRLIDDLHPNLYRQETMLTCQTYHLSHNCKSVTELHIERNKSLSIYNRGYKVTEKRFYANCWKHLNFTFCRKPGTGIVVKTKRPLLSYLSFCFYLLKNKK